MKVIIIGGVAGGATAAARIRRLDENAEIIIFERSGYISYANCGLPYYIGGVIEDKKGGERLNERGRPHISAQPKWVAPQKLRRRKQRIVQSVEKFAEIWYNDTTNSRKNNKRIDIVC